MGEWRRVSIGEICDDGNAELQTGPFGTQLHAHDYVENGIPIVPTEAIRNRQIDRSALPKITFEKAQELARHRLFSGDILFARRGVQATGHIGFVRDAEEGFVCGTGAIRLRIDKDKSNVTSEFLSHVLANPASVAWFKFHAIGATMPNLNEGIVRAFSFDLPPIDEQEAIATILGALDDKIDLNRRMCETLEATARALFKSWFIDFDPIRAKLTGCGSALDRSVAELFPSAFEASGGGLIPENWHISELASVATCVKGRSYKSEELQESDTALVTLKSFSRGGGYRAEGLKSYSGGHKSEQAILPGELIVACTDVTQAADVVGRPAIVRSTSRYSKLVASLDVVIVRPIAPEVSTAFLYCLLGDENFTNYAYAHTIGTTVLHLSGHAIPNYSFVRPPAPLCRRFNEVATPIFDRIDSLALNSETLINVRDTLLPKLISGELRIKDAERFVGVIA